MGVLKTVFRRIGGRIIPIRVRAASAGEKFHDEASRIVEVQKARKYAKFSEEPLDAFSAPFWKYTRQHSKVVGEKIAKRIAGMNKKKR